MPTTCVRAQHHVRAMRLPPRSASYPCLLSCARAQNPTLSFAYCEHTARVKVAKFSPTGKYVASGDATGRVRVWAFTQAEHSLKYELPSIGGEVEDLAWDGESKRILVVGGGSQKAKVRRSLPRGSCALGAQALPRRAWWKAAHPCILSSLLLPPSPQFFSWDTGSQLGEVVPHGKKNITCDFKPQRPFRAVLGGEDFNLSFYAGGPPFKHDKGLKEHSNFVNCVRYAPDGSRFVSVSSDKLGVVYNGETAAVVAKLDAAAGHAGSIYSLAWAADSSRIVTCGGDKTVRLWDMAAEAAGKVPCIATFTLGKAVEDMQMAVVWPSPELVISLSLVRRDPREARPPRHNRRACAACAAPTLPLPSLFSLAARQDGTLNYLTPSAAASSEPPSRRVQGHQAAAQYIDFDPSTGELVTGDLAGRVCVWRPTDAPARTAFVASVVGGEAPTKKVAGVAARGGALAVIAWDDKLRIGDAAGGALTATLALPAQPKGLAVAAAAPATRVVVTGAALLVFQGAAQVAALALDYGATCVDISADGGLVAVGGKDRRIHLYRLGAGGAAPADAGATAEFAGELSVVALHPSGATVAGGDAVREVRLYATAAGALAGLRTDGWVYHTTRVTGLRWNPAGTLLASVSTDRRICVWDPASDAPRLSMDLACPSPFAGLAWVDDTTIWTVAIDGVGRRHALAL